ncbi:BTB/POZ fold protein, partial [Metarhizium majus ARSEF 297]
MAMNMTAAAAASKPYEFAVGPGGRLFTIHSYIVANLSPSLERFVNGPMEEAKAGKAKWESVSEDTFMCFWQFAYTGNYDVYTEQRVAWINTQVKTTDLGDSMDTRMEQSVDQIGVLVATLIAEAEPQPEPALVTEGYDTWEVKKEKRMKKKMSPLSKKERLWAKFTALRETSQSPNLSHQQRSETGIGSDARHLLSHAKVYVFADCYGIVPLMTLSYNKLHQSLVDLMMYAEDSDGVVALAQYCYETDVPDDLRELVILFIACKIEILSANMQFKRLTETYGKLGFAVIELMVNRLE